MILEACVETVEAAITAEKNGANILELCARLDLDGLTPSKKLIVEVLEAVKVPVKLMIRPRAGDFLYTEEEMLIQREAIADLEHLPIYGYVVGALTKNKQIDVLTTNNILQETNKPITFHKAIDNCSDIFRAIDCIISKCPKVKYVLTSGSHLTAMEGLPIIKKMVELYDSKITIIPAGKINYSNLHAIHAAVHARHYHGRSIVPMEE